MSGLQFFKRMARWIGSIYGRGETERHNVALFEGTDALLSATSEGDLR